MSWESLKLLGSGPGFGLKCVKMCDFLESDCVRNLKSIFTFICPSEAVRYSPAVRLNPQKPVPVSRWIHQGDISGIKFKWSWQLFPTVSSAPCPADTSQASYHSFVLSSCFLIQISISISSSLTRFHLHSAVVVQLLYTPFFIFHLLARVSKHVAVLNKCVYYCILLY